MKHEHIKLSAAEVEIFGDFDQEKTWESFDAYQQHMKRVGEEMDRFIESLPNWVEDTQYFDLYLMTDKERELWLAKNSPYFQKTTAHAKPQTVGNYRV
jgi:hypothetical protein